MFVHGVSGMLPPKGSGGQPLMTSCGVPGSVWTVAGPLACCTTTAMALTVVLEAATLPSPTDVAANGIRVSASDASNDGAVEPATQSYTPGSQTNRTCGRSCESTVTAEMYDADGTSVCVQVFAAVRVDNISMPAARL